MLLILPLILWAKEPIPDEQRLDPFQDRVLKVLAQQQDVFKTKRLGYLVKEGMLLDADHPMDQSRRANLAQLAFPQEQEPLKKLTALNVALKELSNAMLKKSSGSELFKAGAPEDTAWILEITERGYQYLQLTR